MNAVPIAMGVAIKTAPTVEKRVPSTKGRTPYCALPKFHVVPVKKLQ